MAFADCTNLRTVKAKGQPTIYYNYNGDSPFKGTLNIDTLIVSVASLSLFDETANIKYMTINGGELSSVNFIRNQTVLTTLDLGGISNTVLTDNVFKDMASIKELVLPENIKEIGASAFSGCNRLTQLTFPATLTDIKDEAFAGCVRLQQMTVNAVEPPYIDKNTFLDVDRTIPVYVPQGSVADYKADPYWREFNIQGADIPDEPTATDEVEAAPEFVVEGNRVVFAEETEVAIYTVSGVCVYKGVATSVTLPHSGIYIVVTPNAATKIAVQK